MEHYQIAKKNATVEDIKRRFINNGICIPYNIYAIDKEGNMALIKNMLYSFKHKLKWYLRILKFRFKGDERNKNYSIFREAFYSAQINYTLKLIFDKEFRSALTKGDWLITKQKENVIA